jgi:uncharacterized protein YbjT (DUF2867 family)
VKIVVLGASRGTGALVCSLALARGHEVTAFARSPDKLVADSPKLTRRVGDFHDEASVRGAVAGHDAVVITAAVSKLSDFKRNPNYFSQGTGYTIDAMKAHGVRKLVVLSALGVGESRRAMPAVARWLVVDLFLRAPYADHERQEAQVKASGLDWVLARPSKLTDGPARGKYLVKTEIASVPSAISRADVAEFLVNACERDTWNGQGVQLGG